MTTTPPGKTSDLRKRLDLKQTRAAALDEIVAAYEKHRSVRLAAAELGITERTLFRLGDAYPELRVRFENVKPTKTEEPKS